MIVDNFDIIKKNLIFTSDFDRYIIHIIKRAKDENGRKYGVNETNRLIKTFYITSIEYFEKKIGVIKELCELNGARAYILPQVRNNADCLKELLKIVVDNLSNPTIKPDHLIRSAYCGYHGSSRKRWIIDLDDDNMVEYHKELNFGGSTYREIIWTVDSVKEVILKQLRKAQSKLQNIGDNPNYLEEQLYTVPTKSGTHIITPPFNLYEAQLECGMLFEGEKTFQKKIDSTVVINYQVEDVKKSGWLHKDGMTLLYFNSETKNI